MKKALSLVLALLVACSMFSIVSFAAAEGDTVTVQFVYETPRVPGEVSETDKIVTPLQTVVIEAGGAIPTGVVPEIPAQFDAITEEGKTYRFTFKGWRCSADGKLYYPGTINFAEIDAADVLFTAEYSYEDISARQSFWNFVESIFERLNKIFEYFAVVFNW